MSNQTSAKTSANAAVCAAIVVLLVAISFLIYHQFAGTANGPKSAIEVAALEAAKDISRIVVTSSDGTYFGNVSLVDDNFLTAGADPQVDLNKRPVLGINTIMGTIRLDLIIAQKLNNKTMFALATEDLAHAKDDSSILRNKIIGACAGQIVQDKYGNDIDVIGNADLAYDRSRPKLGGAARLNDLSVLAGSLTPDAATTNLPTPSPAQEAQVAQPVYPACTPVRTVAFGTRMDFTFAPVAESSVIVKNKSFIACDASSSDFLAPGAVQVSINQPAQAKTRQAPLTTATAQCGGPRQDFSPGALVIGFPQTIPPSGNGADLSSVKTIMNMSQVNATSGTASESPYTGWNAASSGTWLQALGGDVPSSSSGMMAAQEYRLRKADDPSVVLSCLVYDWLRHMYLRPQIDSVADALNSQLGATKAKTSLRQCPHLVAQDFTVPAYAEEQGNYPVAFGLVQIPLNGKGDPRDQRNFAQDPQAYRRQIANVFEYVPAAPTLPDTTLLISINGEGDAITTNGQPAQTLTDFYNQVVNTNHYAAQTIQNAMAVARQKLQEATGANNIVKLLTSQVERLAKDKSPQQAQIVQLEEQIAKQATIRNQASLAMSRAEAAVRNGLYALNMSLAILNDRKAITADGITKNGNNFQLASGTFCPVARAATTQEIIGDAPVQTGQTGLCAASDWVAPPVGGKTKFQLYAPGGQQVSQATHPNDPWIEPVLAATSIPQNSVYMFTIIGDATRSQDQGKILVQSLTALPPDWTADILNGQYEYQNTAAFITTAKNNGTQLAWSCIARDNAANDSGSYYADRSATPATEDNSQITWPLACEWSLRSPAPVPFAQSANGLSCSASSVTVVHSLGNPTKPGSDLTNVTTTEDSAGNITYYYLGQPMHLYSNAASWYSEVRAADAYPSFPYVFCGDGKEQSAINPMTYTSVQWQNWWNSYANSAGGSSPEEQRLSSYHDIIFWTQTGSPCAQMYRWSS